MDNAITFCAFLEKPLRVDIYISTLFSHMSRSYIAKCVELWDIQVNGKCIKKNTKIQNADRVYIQKRVYATDIQAESIPLSLIYEDENILIINKDAGMNVHPVVWIDGKTGTLVNALLAHCKTKLPVISWEERPGIVHRLDKDTSWAIMIAKNDEMMHYLSDIIAKRNIKKYYYAVVCGCMEQKVFTIQSFLGRDRNNPLKITTKNPINPKNSITHGRILWYFQERYTLLELDLETGRTHQIRVHLQSLWHPIVGDSLYGKLDENIYAKKKFWVERQMLHAHCLVFDLYNKKQTFYAPLKDDMKIFFENIL